MTLFAVIELRVFYFHEKVNLKETIDKIIF